MRYLQQPVIHSQVTTISLWNYILMIKSGGLFKEVSVRTVSSYIYDLATLKSCMVINSLYSFTEVYLDAAWSHSMLTVVKMRITHVLNAILHWEFTNVFKTIEDKNLSKSIMKSPSVCFILQNHETSIQNIRIISSDYFLYIPTSLTHFCGWRFPCGAKKRDGNWGNGLQFKKTSLCISVLTTDSKL